MVVESSLARQHAGARPFAEHLATNQLKHRSRSYTTVIIELGLRSRDDNARGVPVERKEEVVVEGLSRKHSHGALTNTWGILCVPRTSATAYMDHHCDDVIVMM